MRLNAHQIFRIRKHINIKAMSLILRKNASVAHIVSLKDGVEEETSILLGHDQITLAVELFRGNTALLEVELCGVSHIPACAFEGCTNLRRVTIWPSTRRIDRYAFAGCDALQEVVVDSEIKRIRVYFSGGVELELLENSELTEHLLAGRAAELYPDYNPIDDDWR